MGKQLSKYVAAFVARKGGAASPVETPIEAPSTPSTPVLPPPGVPPLPEPTPVDEAKAAPVEEAKPASKPMQAPKPQASKPKADRDR